MPTLKKATLQQISADANASPIGDPIEVQFNPASLKLDLANQVEGGDSYGKQQRQYLGSTSTTLAFDLHFDTADQGTADAPVSVRTLTAQVERFLLPIGEGNQKQAPPKCRFHWDQLIIDGIISSLSIDFEFFASNGTPLRAKVGVSIKEQNAKYELLKSGPGANKPGGGASDRSASALDGESVADFAARMGLDPSAWRGIADGLGAVSSLSLQAGVSIDFSSSLSASAGIGVSAGVEADASASLDASFGLDSSASPSASSSSSASTASSSATSATSAGLALTAAGGVSAAVETVASVQAASAADSARRSFASATPSASASTSTSASIAAALPSPSTSKPSMPEQPRTPLQMSGLPSPSTQATASSAPPPPKADTRATTFGFGVPLKPRSRVSSSSSSTDPSAARWTRWPSTSTTQKHTGPCGCGGSHGSRRGASSCR